MPPNSLERTDREGNYQWKFAKKRSSQCMSDVGKSYGEIKKLTSVVLKKGDIDRLSCETCGRKFSSEKERKLLRSMMKSVGLLIIL